MLRNIFQGILIIPLIALLLQAQDRNALIHSVDSLPGWMATGKAVSFNESNLDQFDTRLAESLRLYGVDGVTTQSWRGPSGSVKAALFQLVHPASAYGFFTLRRKAESTSSAPKAFGAESFQSGNRLYFWQSRYVVRLEGDTGAMNALAEKLSQEIVGHSQRPTVANHLPLANIIAGSEEYILAPKDIPKMEGVNPSALGFDDSAEAATAEYRINGKTIRLLLALYPTPQIAKKYAEHIGVSTSKRIGPLLAVISGTSDDSIAKQVMDQVHYESVVTWNEPQPGLGLGPLIVTIFTFIGLLLGTCLIAGLSLGGFRIWMKKYYPDRAFGRASETEIIQLKLDQSLTRKELNE